MTDMTAIEKAIDEYVSAVRRWDGRVNDIRIDENKLAKCHDEMCQARARLLELIREAVKNEQS